MSIIITVLVEIALFVFLYYFIRKQNNHHNRFEIVLLICVLFIVLFITLGVRSYNTKVKINLNLFGTYQMMFQKTIDNIKTDNYSKAWQEFLSIGYTNWSCVILNILLFVPLGYLLPLAITRTDKWWIILLFGIGLSLLIETIQLISHRGWFDVDDILHNGLGTLIGWLCYKHWLKKPKDEKI